MRGWTAMMILVLAFAARAELDPRVAPREVERSTGRGLPFVRDRSGPADAEDGAEDGAVLMNHVRRIDVVSGRGERDRTAWYHGVMLRGLWVGQPDLLAAGVGRWLSGPLTEGGLDRLTDFIVTHYEEHDRPVVDVFVPEQDLSTGTLRIEVTEGRVGVVGLGKTRFFNDELLGGSVRLERGAPLRGSALQEEQDWLNRNPFRSTEMFASPGEVFGEADILFDFEERRPWRAYAGYDNTGTEAAGENRFFAGVNWGNGLGRDHLVNYQLTTGESWSDLHAHALSWEIPLHRRHHFLRLEGAWADVAATSVDGGFSVDGEGTSWETAASYGIVLRRWRDLQNELVLGVEVKHTDNFLTYDGTSPTGAVVGLVQFVAAYRGTRQVDGSLLRLDAGLVASPGGIGGDNQDANFDAFRHGATADYLYGKLGAVWLRRLPGDWSARLAGNVQWADGALLPVEQLALGGFDSVRGYAERLFLADSGYRLSAELRAPPVSWPGRSLPDARLQIAGFLDHGIGWLDGHDNEAFTGAGAGARVDLGPLGQLRADLAWPLDGGDGAKLHVGLLATF